MHSHHITLALADARVADLQTAATRSTATLPPRRHRRALTLIGLAATAVLAASAQTGALAQPLHDASTPANTTRTALSQAQRLREYRETIIALYGSRPASAHPVNPGTSARRELRSSVVGQYGHAR